MAESDIQRLVQLVAQAQKQLDAQLEGITTAELYMPPKEGEWSAAEILAHVIEIQPFWMGKTRLMIEQDNPYVGRTEEDYKQRLSEVEAHAADPIDAILQRLEESHRAALDSIRALPPEHMDRMGQRPEGREVTIRQLVEGIAAHLEEHARQIAANRQAMASP